MICIDRVGLGELNNIVYTYKSHFLYLYFIIFIEWAFDSIQALVLITLKYEV